MLTTTTAVQSRYPDCDRMGIVHHAVYPVWYEIARMEWLEQAGLTFDLLQSLGINPTMVELKMNYRRPAGFPQTLYCTVSPELAAPKKLALLYTLKNADGEIVGEARSFHIWTGSDNKSCDLSAAHPELYSLVLAAVS